MIVYVIILFLTKISGMKNYISTNDTNNTTNGLVYKIKTGNIRLIGKCFQKINYFFINIISNCFIILLHWPYLMKHPKIDSWYYMSNLYKLSKCQYKCHMIYFKFSGEVCAECFFFFEPIVSCALCYCTKSKCIVNVLWTACSIYLFFTLVNQY